MNRITSTLLALMLGFFVIHISAAQHTSSAASKTPSTQQPHNFQSQTTISQLAGFNAISARGNVNVELRVPTQHRFAYSIEQGANVTVKSYNNTVYINAPKRGAAASVLLWGDSIHDISLTDNARLTAQNLTSTSLRITVTNQASVYIRGIVGLTQLFDNSSGLVDIQWINSREVVLRNTGNGIIHLAGVAGLLNAKVVGYGTLDAKFLRANDVLIHTGQRALAQVTPISKLAAFASDQSNIYFFKTPTTDLNRDSIFAGNVLQMGYWR